MVIEVVVSPLALVLELLLELEMQMMSKRKRKYVNSRPNINENAGPVSVLQSVLALQKMLADGNFVPRLVFDMVQK